MLKLKEPRPLITREMILRKFECIEDFAKAAGMSRQNVYLIIKNPHWGRRSDSRKTVEKLFNILVKARKH